MTYAPFGPKAEATTGANTKSLKRDGGNFPGSDNRSTNTQQPATSCQSSQDRLWTSTQSTRHTSNTGGPSSMAGCIIIETGTNPGRPPSLANNLTLCNRHLSDGVECPHGNNYNHTHCQYPNLGSASEKCIFEDWVHNTPGVTWAPGQGPHTSGNHTTMMTSAPARGGGNSSASAPAGSAASLTTSVSFAT